MKKLKNIIFAVKFPSCHLGKDWNVGTCETNKGECVKNQVLTLSLPRINTSYVHPLLSKILSLFEK